MYLLHLCCVLTTLTPLCLRTPPLPRCFADGFIGHCSSRVVESSHALLLPTLFMHAAVSRFPIPFTAILFVFTVCPTSISAYQMLFSVTSELSSSTTQQPSLDARVRCHWSSFNPLPSNCRRDVGWYHPPPLNLCIGFLSSDPASLLP